jgi:hypothetical protein
MTAVAKVVADTHKFHHKFHHDLSDMQSEETVCSSVSILTHLHNTACVRRGGGGGGGGGEAGEEGALLIPYRLKVISVFTSSVDGGGDLLIFIMYVMEFGSSSPESFANQVVVECVDSSPLYSNEDGRQRQELLTATMLGYLEWSKMTGKSKAHLRIPAAADSKQYIFAYRSLDVRIRTSSHLTTWYRRLLAKGMERGVVDSYRMIHDQLYPTQQWTMDERERGRERERGASSIPVMSNGGGGGHALGGVHLSACMSCSAPSYARTQAQNKLDNVNMNVKDLKRHSDGDTHCHRDSYSPAVTFFSSSVSSNGASDSTNDSNDSHTNDSQRTSNSSSSPSAGSDDNSAAGSLHETGDGDSDNGQCGLQQQQHLEHHNLRDSSSSSSAPPTAPPDTTKNIGTQTWFVVELQAAATPDSLSHVQECDRWRRRQEEEEEEASFVMASFLSNRSDLIKQIELDQLKFHSVAHGLYATARLIEVLLHEQRTHNLIAHQILG